MTSVLVSTPYYPPNVGGVQQYAWNLARLLRLRHGFRVSVVTTAERGARATRKTDTNGVTVYRLPIQGRISNTPVGVGWVAAMSRIISDENVDVVNAHGPVPLFADVTRRAAGGVPFVLTYHAGRMRTGRRLADLVCAIYEGSALTATVRGSDELICASEHVAADLPRLFGGRRTTIEPGADLELFRPSDVPEQPRILFSASLERATSYKGLADLMAALVRLKDAVPSVHLEVAGSGSAEQDYRDLARALGIEDRVTFAGYLAGEDLAAAYRRAKVLALPTHFDNYPTVIVEAMATGRPVVSTRVGAIPTFVAEAETGTLVDPGDIAALTEALRTVLCDDDLASAFGAAGTSFVEKHLSWQRQSDRTAEVLQRAMAKAR